MGLGYLVTVDGEYIKISVHFYFGFRAQNGRINYIITIFYRSIYQTNTILMK